MQILHLEDDGPLRDILKVALIAANPELEMQQFISSDEVVDYLASHLKDVDLFILDIRVPGKLDGMGVAQKIRDMGCEKPIVVTSAYQKPSNEVLKTVKITWMPKPWHILDAAQKLLPMAKGQTVK